MALITGRAGTGKTTGIRGFLESLPSSKYRIVYVGQEQRSSGVITRLLHELGAKTSVAWAHRTLKLTQKLQDTIRAGRQLVIVIDEAHLLEQQTLEDIRLLTNLDMDRNTGISVFLLGQHWLRSILKKVGNEALYQRLRLRLALEGLTQVQTGEYIRHHLRLAGTEEQIFTEDAIAEIFAVSEGILREINNIAYDAMFNAVEAGVKIIDKAFLKRVLDQRELN
ncbi:MAG: AAA family ATPase [Verrucomicrobia bacterium]|nr:AAA family ATPase [Verrucomicrobiota bacterium]